MTQPQMPYQPQPQAPAKKRKKWPFVVGGLAAAFVVIGIAGGGGSTSPVEPVTPGTVAPSVEPASTAGASVVEVEGAGEAMVSIMAGGSSSNTVQLPHTAELPEGVVTVSVTRSPSVESYMEGQPDTGEVSCRIIRDGEVVDEQRAVGEYASVTCSKYR